LEPSLTVLEKSTHLHLLIFSYSENKVTFLDVLWKICPSPIPLKIYILILMTFTHVTKKIPTGDHKTFPYVTTIPLEQENAIGKWYLISVYIF
jgi:hypothetical protein